MVPVHTGTFLMYTRRRFEWTHGDVLDGGEGRGGHRQFRSPKFAHVGLSRAPEIQQRNPWILRIFSLRTSRKRHIPDSSNHTLYLMRLLGSNYLEGKRWREPAVRWFGLSFTTKPTCNKRFARQYRDEPSPEFPATLPFSGCIHHLSGPYSCGLPPQAHLKIIAGCRCTYPSIYFHCVAPHNAHPQADPPSHTPTPQTNTHTGNSLVQLQIRNFFVISELMQCSLKFFWTT